MFGCTLNTTASLLFCELHISMPKEAGDVVLDASTRLLLEVECV
jgi:hypothetical protein